MSDTEDLAKCTHNVVEFWLSPDGKDIPWCEHCGAIWVPRQDKKTGKRKWRWKLPKVQALAAGGPGAQSGRTSKPVPKPPPPSPPPNVVTGWPM